MSYKLKNIGMLIQIKGNRLFLLFVIYSLCYSYTTMKSYELRKLINSITKIQLNALVNDGESQQLGFELVTCQLQVHMHPRNTIKQAPSGPSVTERLINYILHQ